MIRLTNGSVLKFFGNEYQIEFSKVKSSKPFLLFFDKKIKFYPSEQCQNFESALIKLIRDKASSLIKKRVLILSSRYQIRFNKLRIKDTKTRWGSCSSLGNINLNWRLAFAPLECLDYMILHELCHIKEMNHSKKFWKEVESKIPDYKVWKKWLRENGRSLYVCTS